MTEKSVYLKVTEDLLKLLVSSTHPAVLNQVYFSILTLVQNLYGDDDIRISTLSEYKTHKFDPTPWHDTTSRMFQGFLMGILNGIKNDIENNLIFNIEKQTIGSVVADFLTLAKVIAEENNKDVAAVLASAAIEDALKRYASLNGLEVDDKEMSDVINALKGKGLLKGPQASVITSHTKTRNKALHAEWDKIEMPEVKSLIAFTEEFILKNLS